MADDAGAARQLEVAITASDLSFIDRLPRRLGAIAMLSLCGSCSLTNGTSRPSPQRGPVFDASARSIRSAFADSSVADVSVEVDLGSRDRGRMALAETLRSVGYVAPLRGGTRFTARARAASAPCADDMVTCRSFTVARMVPATASTSEFNQNGFGETVGIGLIFTSHSTPIGPLGRALARAGVLSCLDGHSRPVRWRGTSTTGRIFVEAGFVEPLDDHDDDAQVAPRLEHATFVTLVGCPIDPRQLGDQQVELRADAQPAP